MPATWQAMWLGEVGDWAPPIAIAASDTLSVGTVDETVLLHIPVVASDNLTIALARAELDAATQVQMAGDSPGYTQSFALAFAGLDRIRGVDFFLGKSGSPVDQMNVDIAAAVDGAAIATATPRTIPASSAWVAFDFGVALDLNPATTYYVRLFRTGAGDTTNQYWVGLRYGSFSGPSGSSWRKAFDSWAPLENWLGTPGDLSYRLAETSKAVSTIPVVASDTLSVSLTRYESLAPTAILASANFTGVVTDIDEDPDAPDGNWLDGTGWADLRVSFSTPSDPLGSGQEFRVLVRPQS